MKRVCNLLFFFLMIMSVTLFAQRGGKRGKGNIYGKVFDKTTKAPIEYANVIIYKKSDSSQVTGNITDRNGIFKITEVPFGNYYCMVQFMGYSTSTIDDIELSRQSRSIDLGEIDLSVTEIVTEGVEVVGNRAPVTYQLDKKIINVAEQATVISGTAADVMENVPSVNVDIDGNVSLRGSSSFTVLIDGVPSVLDANDALQQIPAGSIQNIEIITNPSAKYDPDGTAGIVNIILKKEKFSGFSGMVSMNAGSDDNYGTDFLMNYRNGFYSFFIAGDYNQRNRPGERITRTETIVNNIKNYVQSDGNSGRTMKPYSFQAGLSLFLSERDNVNISTRFGKRAMEGDNKLNYKEWDDNNTDAYQYLSRELSDRSRTFVSTDLNYRHQFEKKGHEIFLQAIYQKRDGDEETINELREKNIQVEGKKTIEKGPSKVIRFKGDYTYPINQDHKLEAGIQGRVGESEDLNRYFQFDSLSGKYLEQKDFGKNTEYNRNINSSYLTYSGIFDNFSVQGGLRGEYTYRDIKLIETGEKFKIDRWDYYPTIHTAYKFENGLQIMASYTRRIKRPRGWYLEPFLTWSDAYNVFKGNPGIKPEFIDSYELGTQLYLKSTLISLETYFRKTNDKIERIREVYKENIFLHTYDNIGKDYSFGGEIMLNTDLLSFWNVNCMGNFYNYKVEGVKNGKSFENDSFTWNVRFNNSFDLGKQTTLQFNGRYNSPSVDSQGESKGYYSADLAVKKQLFEKKLALTLQVRDLFKSVKREFTSVNDDYYYFTRSTRNAPMVMLNISYNFNNFKQEKGKRDQDMGEEEEF